MLIATAIFNYFFAALGPQLMKSFGICFFVKKFQEIFRTLKAIITLRFVDHKHTHAHTPEYSEINFGSKIYNVEITHR